MLPQLACMGHETIVEDGVIAGNYYNKYKTKNPIARLLTHRFLVAVEQLVKQIKPASIHEVGCGEGHLTTVLAHQAKQILATDFSSQVVNHAKNNSQLKQAGVNFEVANVYDLQKAKHGANLVVCCEVLEHLETPSLAMSKLIELADPYLLLSVPREPIWRMMNMARFKYWGALGNTPGHIQHWSKKTFLDFVGGYMNIIEVRTPLPWSIVLGKV